MGNQIVSARGRINSLCSKIIGRGTTEGMVHAFNSKRKAIQKELLRVFDSVFLSQSSLQLEITISSVDGLIMGAIAILATFLQLKFGAGSKSPLETNFKTMVALLVALKVYLFALIAKKKLVETLEAYAGIIKSYVHLCGVLSSDLIAMMLQPTTGKIFLVIWGCFFMIVTCVTCRLHVKISAAHQENSSMNNQAQTQPTDEESNVGNIDQAQTQPTDEESNGGVRNQMVIGAVSS